jgi:hypothetical protein
VIADRRKRPTKTYSRLFPATKNVINTNIPKTTTITNTKSTKIYGLRQEFKVLSLRDKNSTWCQYSKLAADEARGGIVTVSGITKDILDEIRHAQIIMLGIFSHFK